MFLILFRRIRLLLLVIYFFIGWSMYFIEGGQIALWIPERAIIFSAISFKVVLSIFL